MRRQYFARWILVAAGGLGLAGFSVSRSFGQTEKPPTTAEGPSPETVKKDQELQRKKDDRKLFQAQELITAKPFSFIFNPGDPPRIVWRDVDEVRRLGADGRLRVRWFDAELNETEKPAKPGRWGAYIEGNAPNAAPPCAGR